MDLSYEETMRRIEQIEMTTGCQCIRENTLPWHIMVYLGENQILISPLIRCVGFYHVHMSWFRQIKELNNAKLIGESVLEAIEHIRVGLVDARTREERESDSIINATSCKNHNTFNRKYLECFLNIDDKGYIDIGAGGHNERVFNYPSKERRVTLPPNTSAEVIGREIMKQFWDMEAYYHARKHGKSIVPREQFEIISGATVSFAIPLGDEYMDEQDYGSMEIYQGYSYHKEGAEDSVADMYYSIAAELDCDCSKEAVRASFEQRFHAAEDFRYEQISHPVFDTRVEISNKKMHYISYLKQVDEHEILACELYLKVKPAGKRLFTKITRDFEAMVQSTQMSNPL